MAHSNTNAELVQVALRTQASATARLANAERDVEQAQRLTQVINGQLHEDDGKIQNINGGLEQIQHDAKTSKRLLDYMARCFCCQCFFSDPTKSPAAGRHSTGSTVNSKVNSSGHTPPAAAQTKPNRTTVFKGDDATISLPDQFADQEKQLNQGKQRQNTALDRLAQGLDQLEVGAHAIKQKLVQQNADLDRAHHGAEAADLYLSKLNQHGVLRKHVPNAGR